MPPPHLLPLIDIDFSCKAIECRLTDSPITSHTTTIISSKTKMPVSLIEWRRNWSFIQAKSNLFYSRQFLSPSTPCTKHFSKFSPYHDTAVIPPAVTVTVSLFNQQTKAEIHVSILTGFYSFSIQLKIFTNSQNTGDLKLALQMLLLINTRSSLLRTEDEASDLNPASVEHRLYGLTSYQYHSLEIHAICFSLSRVYREYRTRLKVIIGKAFSGEFPSADFPKGQKYTNFVC